MKRNNVFGYLLLAFTLTLAVSVGAALAPTATTAYADSVSATEAGDHGSGIGKIIFGNWNNYSRTSGNPAGYSQQLEENPQMTSYLLLDGMTFAEFEQANTGVNLSVNRYMNGIYVMILSGILPEFTMFTLKAGCPLPYSGDLANIQFSGDTVDKDYNIVWADGKWSETSSDISIANFSALSEPVISGDYTDVSFNIPFSVLITDAPADNLTGAADTNARSKMYFNGTVLSDLSGNPAGSNVTVPKIGANGRFLTITFRMRSDSFDISAIERKAFRIDTGLKLPNYSSGGWLSPATGVYNGNRIIRYYVNEAKCWIRSSVQKARIDFNEENQLFLSDASGNFNLSFDGTYYRFPIIFAGENSVLPAGTDVLEQYNQHYSQLYGSTLASGKRTEASIDQAIGGGYYTSLLENVKVNGIKLSDPAYFGTNNLRVDYYGNYILFTSVRIPALDYNSATVTFTLDGGLFFPSGKNMNGRSVNVIFKPGQTAVTDIAVSAVSAENGYPSAEESKAHPLDIAVNQVMQINAVTVPSDAAIKYLLYDVVETSENGVVKISKKGVLTAKKAGNVTVKISALGGDGADAVKYVTYRVSEFPLERIALEKESETIFVGGAIDLQVYFSPLNASYKELNFTSDDESVATVLNGTITGIKGGKAVITVSSVKYPSVTAKFTVTVSRRVVAVSVTKPNKTEYRQGEDFDTTGMLLKATYDDGTTANVPLSMSTIAGYSKDRIGKQEINVIYEGFYDSFSVNVVIDSGEPGKGCGGSTGAAAVIPAALLLSFASLAKKNKKR